MSAVSPNGNAPKSMSTRLLTMKFMQRATASPTASTTILTNEPSSKRRKKESDSISWRQNVDLLTDRNAVQDALAIEEEKSIAALEKLASESGDTRWVLNYKEEDHPVSAMSLRVVQAGYASLDSLTCQSTIDEFDERPTMLGRRSFGKFNKTLEKQQNPNYTESSEPNEDEDTDMDSNQSSILEDDDDLTGHLIRTTQHEVAVKSKADLKAKNRKTKDDLKQPLSKNKRQIEVSLNNLTSLSGRQEISSKSTIECYSCGGPHRKIDCPRRKRGQQCNDNGPPKKSFRSN